MFVTILDVGIRNINDSSLGGVKESQIESQDRLIMADFAVNLKFDMRWDLIISAEERPIRFLPTTRFWQ